MIEGGVLGLFPSFASVGGVERSGYEAWLAIAGASGGAHHLLCYGPAIPPELRTKIQTLGGTYFETDSQAMSAARAVSKSWPVRTVMAWHLGLLRLLPLLRTKGARIVLFLHGIEAWHPASAATAKLLRRVDLFLTNSSYTWERFLASQPQIPELRSAMHRTVALGLGEPLANAAWPQTPPTALMIGRIARSESYKGHDAAIAAWPRVLAQIPDAKLRMIGPSEITPELHALAQKCGVDHAVEISGAVSEEAKEQYLNDCRCMVLPSRGEGFGLAYIESMRHARPCVVSKSDAGQEVVCSGTDPAGLAVDPQDTASLADAIVRMMRPGEEWDRYSAAAQRRYVQRYTGTHFRERLVLALA